MRIEERLSQLGLKLPKAPPPAANYKPFVQAGKLLFVSGQLPLAPDGKVAYSGKVGAELSVEDGYQAARLCALNGLAQIQAALGSLDRVETFVRIDGHVQSAPGFSSQPKVVNGCSDLIQEVFGGRGGHARVALGHNELPLNAAVEVAFIVAVAD